MAQPVQILNLRASPSGGGLAGHMPNFQPGSSRAIILIHGYNDVLIDAREAFASFLNPQADLGFIRQLPPLAWPAYIETLQGDTLDALSQFGEVCLLFWPSDVLGRLFSALAYVEAIRLARDSAVCLGKTLELAVANGVPGGGPLEIVLICHSLGNRLGLELVNYIGPDPQIQFRAWCSMAAAVPVPMVTAGMMTHDLTLAALQISKRLAMYSGVDSILGFWFPPFETKAGEGDFPEAVGHAGNPTALWLERDDMQPYSHGSYWPAANSDRGFTSRDLILRFLGAALPAQLPSATLSLTAPPSANQIRSNAIAVHATPTRSGLG